MIEFIRPPPGPRVDILRVRALERIQPMPAEDPTRVYVQTEQEPNPLAAWTVSRRTRTADSVEISDAGRRLLEQEESQRSVRA
jgi:hypothetical protein